MATNFFEEIKNDLDKSFKNFELNKGTLILVAVGGVVLLVLLRQRKPQVEQVEVPEEPSITVSDYPRINPSDLDSQFANFKTAILGEVNSNLMDYHSGMMDDTQNLYDDNRKYMDEIKKELEKDVKEKVENQQPQPETEPPPEPAPEPSPLYTIGKGGSTNSNYKNELESYKTDRAGLKNEIERTMSVISYRVDNNLDTHHQRAHLDKLRSM